jgi:hypothetical protein
MESEDTNSTTPSDTFPLEVSDNFVLLQDVLSDA